MKTTGGAGDGVGRLRAAAAFAAALAAAPAAAIDLDDPDATPLHFAVETVSGEAVTVVGRGRERETYYHLEAPPDAAELATTNKLPFGGSGRLVRARRPRRHGVQRHAGTRHAGRRGRQRLHERGTRRAAGRCRRSVRHPPPAGRARVRPGPDLRAVDSRCARGTGGRRRLPGDDGALRRFLRGARWRGRADVCGVRRRGHGGGHDVGDRARHRVGLRGGGRGAGVPHVRRALGVRRLRGRGQSSAPAVLGSITARAGAWTLPGGRRSTRRAAAGR